MNKSSYLGYHGNAVDVVRRSCERGEYHRSKGDRHWLGDGTYFFEDTPPSLGLTHAGYWCEYINHTSPAILKAEINVDDQKVLDLENPNVRSQFHAGRTHILRFLKERGKTVKKGHADGLVLNMWEKLFPDKSLDLVRRSDFYPSPEDRRLGVTSGTPNVTVLCVRNSVCITEPEHISFSASLYGKREAT